ncbi:MAG: DUF488 family protein [Candidatus Marsarchaeota archaeon]|nr:DUF488 family protein [Candidatus Marsarchaeota archaeon]
MLLGIKSIYDKTGITDGRRILVDRLWPRGVRRSTANIDTWMKDIAPSNALRLKLHAHSEWYPVFKKRYVAELEENPLVNVLINRSRREDIMLLYASRNHRQNNAVVLLGFLKGRIRTMEQNERRKEKMRQKILSLRQPAVTPSQ